MGFETLLFLLAIGIVIVFFTMVPLSPRKQSTNLVRSPSEQVGELQGMSWIERRDRVSSAEHEKRVRQADAASAELNDMHFTDKADELGTIPQGTC